MFGFRYIKTEPTTYLMQYKRGKLIREGAGLSFFYFAPSTALLAVPLATTDLPFIFKETTADFQEVTVQGQVVYRIQDPRKLAGLMNFSLNARGDGYQSDAPQKVGGRLFNLTQVLTRAQIQQLSLREALNATESLVSYLKAQLSQSEVLATLGLEALDITVQAIRPTPETARALEATVREDMLKAADEAIYSRRNAAVEQERAIKENELKTEIAVETKKREIRETQMEAERAVLEKKRQIDQEQLEGRIGLEQRRATLVDQTTANSRKEADAKAYAMSSMMQALGGVDSRVLDALAASGMKPEQLMAQAFKQIAGNADKIGQLNISPDLLRELMGKGETA